MNIKIKKNILLDQWVISKLKNDNLYDYLDVYFGFFNQNLKTIQFDSLSFGCELYTLDNTLLQSIKHMPENTNILQTESEYLQVFRLNCKEQVSYKLKIWYNNAGIYNEEYTSFTIPTMPDYVEQFKLHHNGRHPDDPV